MDKPPGLCAKDKKLDDHYWNCVRYYDYQITSLLLLPNFRDEIYFKPI